MVPDISIGDRLSAIRVSFSNTKPRSIQPRRKSTDSKRLHFTVVISPRDLRPATLGLCQNAPENLPDSRCNLYGRIAFRQRTNKTAGEGKMFRRTVLAGFGMALALSPSSAQLGTPFGNAIIISTADLTIEPAEYGLLYEDGFAATTFIAEKYVFTRGFVERLGAVRNFLIDSSGQVVAAVVAVGGLWDIGDAHISVPWGEVRILEGNSITVPDEVADEPGVAAQTLDPTVAAQTIVHIDEDVALDGLWSVDALIGSSTELGVIREVILAAAGAVYAVIVDPDG